MVTVVSNMQTPGRLDFDDLQAERSYSGARAHNQSKLANVLFTHELARRAAGHLRHRQRAASRHDASAWWSIEPVMAGMMEHRVGRVT